MVQVLNLRNIFLNLQKFNKKFLMYILLAVCGLLAGLSFTAFTESFALRIIVNGISVSLFLYSSLNIKNKKEAFFQGTVFGFLMFFVSLLDIKSAFDAVNQIHLFLPCMIFLCFGLSLFLSLPIVLSKVIKETKLTFIYVPLLLTIFEFIRSEIFPQFPINTFSSIFSIDETYISIRIIQIVKYIGIYALSFLWLSFLSSIVSKKIKAVIVSTLFILLVFIIGSVSLKKQNQNIYGSTNIVMIQPNIPQKMKLNVKDRSYIFEKTINLINAAQNEIINKIDLIILPESAFPGLFFNNSNDIKKIQNSLIDKETILIFGADRAEEGDGNLKLFNSMFVVSKEKIIDVYDKVKLLPFGEYIPMRNIFPSFFNYILGGMDYTSGEKTKLVHLPSNMKISPNICSESMFKKNHKDANFILTILNDGWFGKSIKLQHFAIDRLRTIQSGIPMLRVSNNGISAFINKNGEKQHEILEDNKETCMFLKLSIN